MDNFFPIGGAQNNFLWELHKQKQINDNRLCQIPKTKKYIPLSESLSEKIEHLFKSIVSVSLKNTSTSCEFSFSEFVEHIYSLNPNKIKHVNLIGGFVKKILVNSKEYLITTLSNAGIKNARALLKTPLLDCQQEAFLGDVDLRIHIQPNAQPGDFSFGVVNYLQQKFKESTPRVIIRGVLSKFYKFEKSQEIKTEIKHSKTLSVAKKNVRTLNMAIVSFGKINLKTYNDKPEVECIVVSSLIRQFLTTDTALKIDCLPLLNSQKKENKLGFHTLYFVQAIIDILSDGVHIPEPESVDQGGFIKIISGILHRKCLFENKEVLEWLIKTFLEYHQINKSLSAVESMAKDIENCLKNHHQVEGKEEDSRVFFLYNFASLLHPYIKESLLLAVWLQVMENKVITSPLAELFHEALNKHSIPFSILESLIQIAAFFAMKEVSVRDERPPIALKWHIGALHIQIKMGKGESSYVLVPFLTSQTILKLENFINSSENSKEKEWILLELFEALTLYKSENKDGDSLITAHEKELVNVYKKLASSIESMTLKESSFLRYMGYRLLFNLSPYTQAKFIIERFPIIFVETASPEKKVILWNNLAQTLKEPLKGSDFDVKEGLESFFEESFALFPSLQNSSLSDVIKLYYPYFNKLNETDLQLSTKIINDFLSLDDSVSLYVLQALQSRRHAAFKLRNESSLIFKVVTHLEKLEKNQISNDQIESLTSIFKSFFFCHKQKKNSNKFTNACFLFAKIFLKKECFSELKLFLKYITLNGIISKEDDRWVGFWLALLTHERSKNNYLQAYEIWQDGEKAKIWEKGQCDKFYKIKLDIVQFLFSKSRYQKGLQLFDTLVEENPESECIRKAIAEIVRNDFNKNLQIGKATKIEKIYSKFLSYGGFLSIEERFLYAVDLLQWAQINKCKTKIFLAWDFVIREDLRIAERKKAVNIALKLLVGYPEETRSILDHENFTQLIEPLNELLSSSNALQLNWPVFLEHRQINEGLSKEALCQCWTIYLIDSGSRISNVKRSTLYLIKNYNKVKSKPKACIEVIIKKIMTFNAVKSVFNELLTVFLEEIQEAHKYYTYSYTKERFIEFTLNAEEKDPIFIEHFSYILVYLLKRFFASAVLSDERDFVYHHLKQLISHSPHTKDIIQLVEKYLFLLSPNDEEINEHIASCILLINFSFEKGLYKNYPEKFIKIKLYLDEYKCNIPGNILLELISDLVKYKDKFLETAVKILMRSQCHIEEKSDEALLKCYYLIFECVKKHADPQFFLNVTDAILGKNGSLFLRRKPAYGMKNIDFLSQPLNSSYHVINCVWDFCSSFALPYLRRVRFLTEFVTTYSENAPTTANFLFKNLLEAVIPINQKKPTTFDLTSPDIFRVEIFLVTVLDTGLLLGAFIGEQQHHEYYNLLERALSRVKTYLKRLNTERVRTIFPFIYRLIAGKEDKHTLIGNFFQNKPLVCAYSKEIKEIRRKLMQQWINFLDHGLKINGTASIIRTQAIKDGIL